MELPVSRAGVRSCPWLSVPAGQQHSLYFCRWNVWGKAFSFVADKLRFPSFDRCEILVLSCRPHRKEHVIKLWQFLTLCISQFDIWMLDQGCMVVGAVWTEHLQSLLLASTPSTLQNTIYPYGICIVLGTLGHLEVMYLEEMERLHGILKQTISQPQGLT